MDPRKYLEQYLEKHGGPAGAARHLAIPYPTICAIANGTRGISPKMARRMAAADPDLDPGVLVWVRATKADTFPVKAATPLVRDG